jgi:hypothetical protein
MTSCTQVVNGGNYEWNCANTECKCVPDSTFCGGPGTVIDITTAIEGVKEAASVVCQGNNLSKCSLIRKIDEGWWGSKTYQIKLKK